MKRFISIFLMAIFLFSSAQISVANQKFRDWEAVFTYDKVTKKEGAYIYTTAKSGKTKWGETPYMGINCNSVYFGNVATLDDENVTWRFDNQSKATYVYGDKWQGSKGTTISFRQALGTSNTQKAFRYYKTYFKNFVASRELYVNFDMYASPKIQATFSMMGATAAIDWLQRSCWVNDIGIWMAHDMFGAVIEYGEKCTSEGRDCTDEEIDMLDEKYGYDTLD